MRVPAVSQTAVVSPWKFVDVADSPLASVVTGARMAHHGRLLVLSRDNCYAAGPADERSQKSRSPVTFRSSGFDQATISLDVIAVNLIQAASPGRIGALAPHYSRGQKLVLLA
jgi:hypothetical protein